MNYKVQRTIRAKEQLYAITRYITLDSGSKEIAERVLDKLEGAIMLLGIMPHMGSTPQQTILREQGYRVVIVDKRYLIFHKVNDAAKRVTVYNVVDTRRDYTYLV
ncbi:MAG: type II toxin-antitoxin system RelE/ParE family toxin [Oscillospiraceae bacterium]|jgi:plasmid stabilization system protein ParE|nr:type II toxin-antitoxin system RelE/ParE family toxin [Oscillospiraceae bacterium]